MLFYKRANDAGASAPFHVRRVRALTAYALAAYPVGGVIMLISEAAENPWLAMAGLAVIVSAIAACFGFIGGAFQRITGDVESGLDERELDQRRRAQAFAYQAFGALTMFALIYLAIASDKGLWVPASYDAWNAVWWGALLYLLTLPTAFLAWTTPIDLDAPAVTGEEA